MMASSLQKIEGDDSVLLRVTHSNIKTFSADIRFSLQMSVESVKEKLWKKCGTSVNSMHLELYDDTNHKISDLTDNSRPLGFYSPLDGFRLHVVDLDPSSVTSGGWLEDTSLVEKYTISEEAYNKREGTFRKFKEKFSSQIPSAVEAKVPDTNMESLCSNIKVDSRCEVEPGEKRGVVKFVGQAEALGPGFWVGVQYDEPLGKHDGMLVVSICHICQCRLPGSAPLLGLKACYTGRSGWTTLVKGVRYFECSPSHGAMVRPEKVKVGDYPERDPFEEDEI